MKRKSVLGICLALLILMVTACSGQEDVVQGSIPGYESEVQGKPQTQASGIGESQGNIQDQASGIGESHEGFQAQASESGESQEATVDDNLPIYGEYYYDLENVVLYLEVYGELPSNYITKSEAQSLGWEGGSVEKYQEGAAIGGDVFGNREGLLPKADGRSYTECDIDTNGYSSRGSRRLVFSNDGLYFYTSDHYETFTEVIVTEDYEVIW